MRPITGAPHGKVAAILAAYGDMLGEWRCCAWSGRDGLLDIIRIKCLETDECALRGLRPL